MSRASRDRLEHLHSFLPESRAEPAADRYSPSSRSRFTISWRRNHGTWASLEPSRTATSRGGCSVLRVTVATTAPRPRLAMSIAGPLAVAGFVGFALADHSDLTDPLTWALIGIATASALLSARFSEQPLSISPSFICAMLAVAFLGPASTFLVLFISETAAWIYERYRWRAYVLNLAGIPTPAVAVAFAFAAAAPDEGSAAFFLLLALATAVFLALDVAIVLGVGAILDGQPVRTEAGAALSLLPTFAISSVLTLAIAEGYIVNGLVRRRLPARRDRDDRLHGAPGHALADAGPRVREPLLGHPLEPDPHARRARPPRRPALRRRRALLARHRRPRADAAARPGARAHRRPAARHRQVRAVGPRHGARRGAHRRRLARHPPPPRHRRRPAARHRRVRARRRDRPLPSRAPRRPRLPARPHRRRTSPRSRRSSPSPRSTTRSRRRTPTARR